MARHQGSAFAAAPFVPTELTPCRRLPNTSIETAQYPPSTQERRGVRSECYAQGASVAWQAIELERQRILQFEKEYALNGTFETTGNDSTALDTTVSSISTSMELSMAADDILNTHSMMPGSSPSRMSR